MSGDSPRPKDIQLTLPPGPDPPPYETKPDVVQDMQSELETQKEFQWDCWPFCPCTNFIFVIACQLRLCANVCCVKRADGKCCRPTPNDENETFYWCCWALFLCCIWERVYEECCIGLCMEKNRWCCIPLDCAIAVLLLLAAGAMGVFEFTVGFDMCLIALAVLMLALDPICCILSGGGKHCKWRCGFNSLFCCTITRYEHLLKETEGGKNDCQCGDDDTCSPCYLYSLQGVFAICLCCLLAGSV
eukprot:903059_1